MSDIGSINPLTGANPALNRDAAGSTRPAPTEPPTVQNAVASPLTSSPTAVTQSPTTGNSEWQQNASSDNHQANSPSDASDRQQLQSSLERLNKSLSFYNTRLQFEVDDKYQEMVVRVVDTETKEVVRQIPPDKALALAQFFEELEETQRTQPASSGDNTLGSSNDFGRLGAEGWLLRAIA